MTKYDKGWGIENLKDRKYELNNELTEVNLKIKQYYITRAERKWGIKVGDIVLGNNGKKHRIAKIISGEHREKPWLEGNPERKDGTYGTAVRNLYNDWELLKEGG